MHHSLAFNCVRRIIFCYLYTGNGENNLTHAVLLVGYGKLDGKDYWLIKNSWSATWGLDGYILMSQENNNCGVATTPSYALF